jgi:hypothetical protein
LKEWFQKVKARPAVQAGLDVPEKNKHKDITDPKELEKIAKEASSWVLKGMNDDKKK